MQKKIVYKNRFRVRDLVLGKIIALNTITDARGVYRFVAPFDSYAEALAAMKLNASYSHRPESEFKVESYGYSQKHEVPVVSEAANKILARMKAFSGKGLAYNTLIPKKDERKYDPSRYYTREIHMFQSMERNKGLSTLPRAKADKSASIVDTVTAERIQKLKSHGTLEGGIIDNIRKKIDSFPNRKALKDHLRKAGFSVKQTNKLICKVYAR